MVSINDLIDLTVNVPCKLCNEEVDLQIYDKVTENVNKKDVIWICGVCKKIIPAEGGPQQSDATKV